MAKVVLDTSSLIFLSRLGRLSLLRRFDEVIVPRSVMRELSAGISKDPVSEGVVREALRRGHLSIVELRVPTGFLPDLGEGERTAIYLATRAPGTVLITDDGKALRAARGFQLPALSVPFLLAEGVHLGDLDLQEMERDLDRFLELGGFLSARLYREALRVAGMVR